MGVALPQDEPQLATGGESSGATQVGALPLNPAHAADVEALLTCIRSACLQHHGAGSQAVPLPNSQAPIRIVVPLEQPDVAARHCLAIRTKYSKRHLLRTWWSGCCDHHEAHCDARKTATNGLQHALRAELTVDAA